jgi:hypothetical protein
MKVAVRNSGILSPFFMTRSSMSRFKALKVPFSLEILFEKVIVSGRVMRSCRNTIFFAEGLLSNMIVILSGYFTPVLLYKLDACYNVVQQLFLSETENSIFLKNENVVL